MVATERKEEKSYHSPKNKPYSLRTLGVHTGIFAFERGSNSLYICDYLSLLKDSAFIG